MNIVRLRKQRVNKEMLSMDLFEKCYNYTTAKEAIAAGVYPYFHYLETGQDTEVIMEGRPIIMIGSNNYQGLASDPRVVEAAKEALLKYGSGCSGSRFLNGTLKLHIDLEDKLAKFLNKEAAITFSTGFQSNLGIISAIAGRTIILSATRKTMQAFMMLVGCYAKMVRYEHNDMRDPIRFSAKSQNKGILIVTDGVFSMGGDICNLPEIVSWLKNMAPGSWWMTLMVWVFWVNVDAERLNTSDLKTKWISLRVPSANHLYAWVDIWLPAKMLCIM